MDDPEARKDWRIGVRMADGSTSYEIIHDETEKRALRQAVTSAAHYRGRDGTNPPIRITSVQTFEDVVVPEEDHRPFTNMQYERQTDRPRQGSSPRQWIIALVLGIVLLAFMLGATRIADAAGYDCASSSSPRASSSLSPTSTGTEHDACASA